MNTFYLILFASALCLLSSCTDEPSSSVSSDRGSIQGIVRNDKSVVLSDVRIGTIPESVSATTDVNGQYSIADIPAGIYTINASTTNSEYGNTVVEVKGGKTTVADILIYSTAENRPPNSPSNFSPKDSGRIPLATTVSLSWQCSDPENDIILYDVYLSNSPILTEADKILTDHISRNIVYNVATSDTEKVYYWQVVAKDIKGHSAKGPVLHFRFSNINTGLILWLPFNGNCVDQSDAHLSSGAYNIQYGTDRHGNNNAALQLQGSQTSLVQINHNDIISLGTNEDLSLSYWMQFSSQQANGAGIISKFSEDPKSGFKGWQVVVSNQKYFRVDYRNNAFLSSIVPNGVFMDDNKWHHVVVVFQRSQKKQRIYVDGRLISDISSPTLSQDVNTNEPIRIGLAGGTTVSAFKGTIDDVRIYKRELGDKEVAILFAE